MENAEEEKKKKGKRIEEEDDEEDYDAFLEEVERDPEMRKNIDLYRVYI